MASLATAETAGKPAERNSSSPPRSSLRPLAALGRVKCPRPSGRSSSREEKEEKEEEKEEEEEEPVLSRRRDPVTIAWWGARRLRRHGQTHPPTIVYKLFKGRGLEFPKGEASAPGSRQ